MALTNSPPPRNPHHESEDNAFVQAQFTIARNAAKPRTSNVDASNQLRDDLFASTLDFPDFRRKAADRRIFSERYLRKVRVERKIEVTTETK